MSVFITIILAIMLYSKYDRLPQIMTNRTACGPRTAGKDPGSMVYSRSAYTILVFTGSKNSLKVSFS